MMPTKIPVKLEAYLLLFLAQAMVAAGIVGAKYLVATIPVLLLLVVRFALASLFLSLLHMSFVRKKVLTELAVLSRKDWAYLLLQSATAALLFNALMLLGLGFTDANVAGIITSALPALILFFSWLILREKFTLKKLICISLATLGLLVISGQKFNESVHASVLGNCLVFLALVPEALYYILNKLHPLKLPLFLLSAMINGLAAVALIPAIFFVDWQTFHISVFAFGVLVLISMTSGLFYVFWGLASVRVDTAEASLSTAVVPVATVVIAWLCLDESITLIDILGMLLIISSIGLYARTKKPIVQPG